MFGQYTVPFALERDDLSLSIERVEEGLLYHRSSDTGDVEKLILSSDGDIRLSPVEPLNKPKELTPNLLIEFERPLMAAPRSKKGMFVKFPLEIGVLIRGKRGYDIIDILNLTRRKFTLYGEPKDGVICKYWKSATYQSLPGTDPVREGVMWLTVSNATDRWVEVRMAVFNAYGMKLYNDDRMAAMTARMKITGEDIAETVFTDSPLRSGMTKSHELYPAKGHPVRSARYVMEWGL